MSEEKIDVTLRVEDPQGVALFEQRKALQPFVDVFKAAQAWAISDTYSRKDKADELQKACDKAREDLAQIALDAYLKTLPAKQQEATK